MACTPDMDCTDYVVDGGINTCISETYYISLLYYSIMALFANEPYLPALFVIGPRDK